jgi:hypothetical protein
VFSLAYLADFPFPDAFETFSGATPSMACDRDGTWYVQACGKMWSGGHVGSGVGDFGLWAFEWPKGATVAVTIGKISTERGGIALDDRLYPWGWNGHRLSIYKVVGFIPPGEV